MNNLTQEDRCEINNIRYEIQSMQHLSVTEKLDSLSIILRGMVELYTRETVLGTARYELEQCLKRSSEKSL